ncbi:hypothetical protein [uncultured Parabacteroides sp.]|uniref:DUF7666 domain-containing protein n=1 Tax=uncultured Parabacteroides sp. TaxID=512312 RepID=UPI0026775346|nr:hypothetical protein [uncultured Parabacteroides sp.]
MDKIKGYKGFNKNLQCRDFQYKINGEYEEKGNIKTCSNGFHFCEEPFDVFSYYPPCSEDGENRYCEVEGSGNIDRDNDDSKIAFSKIKIKAEIGLNGIIKAGINFILEKIDWNNNSATNTGDRSAATNTGDRSAATNTGDRSAAIVNGEESIAIVTGYKSKAKGCIGSWLVLTERDDWDGETYPIKEVKAVKVDGCNIKKDTFYMLINGKVEKVE